MNGSTHRGSKNATPTGINVGAVPELGNGFCRSLHTSGRLHMKQIYFSSHKLLHQVGRSESLTGKYGGSYGEIPLRTHLVSIWLSNRTYQRPRKDHFFNSVVQELTQHYAVVHQKSTPYYPQANGLAESTNKTLQNILKTIVNENRTNWDTKLYSALWAYRTSYKTSIQSTPFRLAFGLEAVMPVEFQVPSLRIQILERLPEEQSEHARLQQLLELDEIRVRSMAILEQE